jgi:hypothetical protein
VLSFDCGVDIDFRPRHCPAQNLTVVYKEAMMQGDVVDRKRLEDLHPEQYTSILILSDADNLGTVDSDSRCIAGALNLNPSVLPQNVHPSHDDNLGSVDSDSRCIVGSPPVLCCLRILSTQMLACSAAGSPVATSHFR